MLALDLNSPPFFRFETSFVKSKNIMTPNTDMMRVIYYKALMKKIIASMLWSYITPLTLLTCKTTSPLHPKSQIPEKHLFTKTLYFNQSSIT